MCLVFVAPQTKIPSEHFFGIKILYSAHFGVSFVILLWIGFSPLFLWIPSSAVAKILSASVRVFSLFSLIRELLPSLSTVATRFPATVADFPNPVVFLCLSSHQWGVSDEFEARLLCMASHSTVRTPKLVTLLRLLRSVPLLRVLWSISFSSLCCVCFADFRGSGPSFYTETTPVMCFPDCRLVQDADIGCLPSYLSVCFLDWG